MQENLVQILHVFENHWITIYGLKIKNINNKKTIKSFEKMINSTSSQFKVDIISVQQQPNTTDCCIFAIAIATDLLYGNSLSNVSHKHENTCLFV